MVRFLAVILLMLQVLVAHSFAYAFDVNDEYFSSQWYLYQVDAPQAWDVSLGKNFVTVAVIDTGIDINHEDINFWKNEGEILGDGIDNDNNGYIDDVNGWDFQGDTNDVGPDDNLDVDDPDIIHHGTIVSGIIAGIPNNGVGIAGITWKAEIMPLKIVGTHGVTSMETINRAIYYAVDNGADLINVSLVSVDGVHGEDFDKAIQYAYDNDVLIIAAAGNGHTRIAPFGFNLNSNPVYPVCSVDSAGKKITLGVGASDKNDNKASFSNYGADCINVSAPGVQMFSTLYENREIGLTEKYGGAWFGTSFAAPVATGTAAYLLSIDPSLTPDQLIERLVASGEGLIFADEKFVGQLGTRINTRIAVQNLLNDINGIGVEEGDQEPVIDTVVEHQNSVPQQTVVFGGRQPMTFIATPHNDGKPKVQIFDEDGVQKSDFFAYNAWDTQGVQVKRYAPFGTLPGYFVAPAKNAKPLMRLYNEGGILLREFLVYGESFRGGVNFAVGNVDDSGGAELVTVPRSNGGPHVRIFNDRGELKSQFFAHDASYRGGLSVDVGDVNGDGVDEIVIGLGENEKPIVKVFDMLGNLISEKMVYAENFRGGVDVAVGNMNHDSYEDIAVAARQGGGPHVRVFSGNDYGLINQFFAYDTQYRGGLVIESTDFDQDGLTDLILTSETSGDKLLKVFTADGDLIKSLDFSKYYKGGISVIAY